jgi:hypothetical protein
MGQIHRVGVCVLACAASAGLGAWVMSGGGLVGPGDAMIEPAARAAQAVPDRNVAKVRFELVRRAGSAAGGDSIETHLVVLRSRAVLERVVRDASVRKSRWGVALRVNEPEGEERAIGQLGELTTAVGLPGTGFFDLTVTAEDPSDARLLANSIAEAFVLETEIRQRRVELPVHTLLWERHREAEAMLASLGLEREAMILSRRMTGIDPGWSLNQALAESWARELVEAKCELQKPQAQVAAAEERVQRAENALELLRTAIIDECSSRLAMRDIDERRAAAFTRRDRTQAQLDDFNVQMQAGPVVRVIERPPLPLGGDEKGA